MMRIVRNRQGQVVPFMILIVALLLLAIGATIIIGEAGYNRIRLANVADSALLSATSSLCRSLNQIRILHTQMFLNTLELQVQLLVSSPWATKLNGYIYAWSAGAFSIIGNFELLDKAWDVADEAVKTTRASLYESAFGGGLVDEPKPFLEEEGEVVRNASGRIIKIDYDKYSRRDSHFLITFRDYKKNTSGWYNSNEITYYYNKTKSNVLSTPGTFAAANPGNYEAYVKVHLNDVVSSIDVIPMPMILIFFWCTPCTPPDPCCWFPGFVLHPFAWIATVDLSSDSFGVTITKSIPFVKTPFFPQNAVIYHTNQIRVSGDVWGGFHMRMEE